MKNNARFLIIFVIGFMFFFKNVYSQDSQLSQFYTAPHYLSPSFAGGTAGTRAVLNARDQWPEIPGAFVTYAFSLDHYLPSIRSGVGLFFFKDQAGSAQLSTTNVGLQYSYDVALRKRFHIRPGIQFYYSQRSINFSNLLFGDQMNLNGNASSSVEIPSMTKVGYLDLAVSTIFYTTQTWGGITIEHLGQPNQSLINSVSIVPVKYMLFGGYKHPLNGKLGFRDEESLNFAANYKSQGKFDQLDIGAYWMKKPLIIGLWYRGIPIFKKYDKGYGNNDAIILLAGYQLEKIKIGFSYDFTMSRLVSHTGGAYEVSIIYEFNQEQKLKRSKKKVIIPCPKF